MKQISTGFGLAVLGACVLGAAFIASPRFGQQAFAQVTGDRRIVSASVYAHSTGGSNGIYGSYSSHFAYRIWSDNNIEVKYLGYFGSSTPMESMNFFPPALGNGTGWRSVDNGLTTFVPADVDANGTVDTGDVSNVLLDFGATQAGNAPPPIDCTINAPR